MQDEPKDTNVERLIRDAYRPETPDAAFAARLTDDLCEQARQRAERQALALPPARPAGRWFRWAMAAAAAIVVALAADTFVRLRHIQQYEQARTEWNNSQANVPGEQAVPTTQPEFMAADQAVGITPRPRNAAATTQPAVAGQSIQTAAGERRRVPLADGSVLYLNQNTAVRIDAERQVTVSSGEVYVEVAPRRGGAGASAASPATFVVNTPGRQVTALGTKFDVQVEKNATDVMVTQGKVSVSGVALPLAAGQQLSGGTVAPALRASSALAWAQDLIASADSPLVPASEYQGGAVVVVDPNGQESRLELRKYHVDTYIEDGFVRTTIDQTYFNHENRRLEGTFYFPLPPDGSLSRLAMYVDGNLMEGGMAERDYARTVYESIVTRQKDPALLEWIDGSTFKMRVFPLEARQEKRIVISYTQKLDSLYGRSTWRFPGGHSLGMVRDWSFHAQVKGGASMQWSCDSQALAASVANGDLLLDASAKAVKPDKDIVLKLYDASAGATSPDTARFSTFSQDGYRYLMLRYRPNLPAEPVRQRRDWVFLFESSADRDPVLARTQIDVIKGMLENTEHDDTFAIVSAGTRAEKIVATPMPATGDNIAAAVAALEKVHLIGALDLAQGLDASAELLKGSKNPYLVHVGGGVASLGERKEDVLAKRIPDGIHYVGVAVGKHWSRPFMKAASERSGGYMAQINPDEPVAWRAFDLVAALNMPRLLGVKVVDEQEKLTFLNCSDALSQGEELCAITRVSGDQPWPASLTITGTLNGQAFRRSVPVPQPADGAGYLPRTWAKLEIDRLLAESADSNKTKIVELSKAMYVMSPFTSLLVLENEAMYQQYGVDRGRKDHWAMYPCPAKIPVVYEPDPRIASRPPNAPATAPAARSAEQVMGTLLVRIPPKLIYWPGYYSDNYRGQTITAWQAYTQPVASDLAEGGYDLYLGDRLGLRYQGGIGHRDLAYKGKWAEDRGGLWWDDRNGEMAATRVGRESRLFRDLDAGRTLRQLPGDAKWNWKVTGKTGQAMQDIRGRGFYYDPRRPIIGSLSATGTININGATFSTGASAFTHYPNQPIPGSIGSATISGATGLTVGSISDLSGYSGLTISAWDSSIPLTDLTGLGYPVNPAVQADIQERTRLVEALAAHVASGRMRSQLSYQRPGFSGDARAFGDLLQYAPAMNTSWADVLATVEAEAQADARALGSVDPAARKLIDAARSAGWQRATFPAEGARPAFSVTFDGAGRFFYDRVMEDGLREIASSDGSTLLHLYPEIGVGARRTVSRFHRADISAVLPWVLAPADDLARGFDVSLIDARTVQLTPRGAGDVNGKPQPYAVVRLVFYAGRLAERAVVEMPSGKLLGRQVLDPSGAVRLLDGDGKETDSAATLAPADAAPDLNPSTKDLVVFAMPFRTTDEVTRHYNLSGDSTAWSDEAAMAMIGANLGQNQGQLATIIATRYFAKGDRRIGFYTLLAAANFGWDSKSAYYQNGQTQVFFDPVKDYPDSALARYVAQSAESYRRGINAGVELSPVGGQADGLLQRLSTLRSLYWAWQTGQATRTDADRQAYTQRTFDFARLVKDPAMTWVVLNLLINHTNGDAAYFRQLAVGYELCKDVPALAFSARYELARCLRNAGDSAGAQRIYSDLLKEAADRGSLIPIDSGVRDAFQSTPETQLELAKRLRQTYATLIAKTGRPTGVYFAWQCSMIGEQALAEELLMSSVTGMSKDERLTTTLAAVDYLNGTGQYPRADEMVQTLLEDKEYAPYPELWWLGALAAGNRGMLARQLACQERAMELEFENMPAVVNVEAVRNEYSQLLGRYQQLADAVVSLDGAVPKDFVAKVVRAADRWRSLDADPTTACQAAASVLQRLGQSELAWAYLTTPLAGKPNESAPWQNLATGLKQAGEYDLADRAYVTAFQIEPTNAQLLWERAQLLQQRGRITDAGRLFAQLATGTWEPRFASLQSQAKSYVGATTAPSTRP